MYVASSNYLFTKGIPPIGLAYISGSLNKHNIEHQVIDAIGEGMANVHQLTDISMSARGLTFKEIIEKISENSQLVCLSVMFSNEWYFVYELIKKIRKRFPHIPILIGGEHVSADAENILRFCPEVDFCAYGEGDETIVDFYEYLLNNKPLDKCTGIYYRKNHQIIKAPPTPRITEIDELTPNWEQIPLQNYIAERSSMNTVSLKTMPMTLTRGCPYECTFCSSPQMWGKRYVMRSPKKIVDEMKDLKDKYQIEHIDFTDLSPTVNKQWTKDLCQEIIKAELNISFQFGAGTRSEILDEETLVLLKKAGLWKLILAAESGSYETQKKIKKRVNLKKFSSVIHMAKKTGHHVKIHFIMGFPKQSTKEAFQSTLFLFKAAFLGVEDTPVYSYMPYPGTELTEDFNINFKDSQSYSEHYRLLAHESYVKIKDFHCHGSYPKWLHPFFTIFTSAASTVISRVFYPKNSYRGLKGLIEGKPKGIVEMMIFNTLNKKSEAKRISTKRTTVQKYLFEYEPFPIKTEKLFVN